MNNIENTYINYDSLIEEVGEKVIQHRFEEIYKEMQLFVKNVHMSENVIISHDILMQALLDYFSDVLRLKKYQSIERINSIKINAYESFWLLQRKPIQIINPDLDSDVMLYINEKFVLTRIASFLLEKDITRPILEERKKAFHNFLDTLYYFMKFRRCDAQALELMILAFKAGRALQFEEVN